jgi:hypothetical protein
MQKSGVRLAFRKPLPQGLNEQGCPRLANLAEPAAIGDDQEPQLRRWNTEIADLERQPNPRQPPYEQRLWRAAIAQHEKMRTVPLPPCLDEKAKEIRISIPLRIARKPKAAQFLHFRGIFHHLDTVYLYRGFALGQVIGA